MNWISDFEENTQGGKMISFNARIMLGKDCHLLFFKELLERTLRIWKAVIKAYEDFIDLNNI